MKKRILILIAALGITIFASSCLKNKEYCWSCSIMGAGWPSYKEYCEYTEDEIKVFMDQFNADNPNAIMISCGKN